MASEVYRIRSWRFVRRLLWKLALLPVSATAIFFSVYIRTSPYPPEDALRHLMAAQGCATARMVDLAPARVGGLGYHARNDADGDGIACETPGAAQATAEVQYRGGAKFLRP